MGPNAAVEALRRAARAGDTAALERLLRAHHARLLGYAKRRVGADWQGRIEPEDVLQDAYVEVFAAVSQFEYRGEDSFYHWVARIIDHRFVDHVRRLRRKKRDATREVHAAGRGDSIYDPLVRDVMAEMKTAGAVFRGAEAVAAIMACMARLEPDHREVIRRLYVNHESPADAAAALGRSEDAVRRLAGRALDALREHVGNASRFL